MIPHNEGCPLCFPGKGPRTHAAKEALEWYHDGPGGYHGWVEKSFPDTAALYRRIEEDARQDLRDQMRATDFGEYVTTWPDDVWDLVTMLEHFLDWVLERS